MEPYSNIKVSSHKDFTEHIFFVALKLPKETNLLLDLLPHLFVTIGDDSNLNHYGVNNMHFDQLQEFICKEICLSFRSTYTE